MPAVKVGRDWVSSYLQLEQLAENHSGSVKNVDRSIANLWVKCSARTARRGKGSGALPSDDGDVLDFLLERILGTGRAYWEKNLHRPLRRGPAMEASIQWTMRSDARQSPQIVVPANARCCEILCGSSPWYVDVSNDIAGVIRLPYSREVVQTLLAAPRVSPAEAAAVSESLFSIDRTFPLPRLDATEEIRGDRPVPCLLLRYRKFEHPRVISDGTSDVQINGDNIAILSFDYGFDDTSLSPSWISHRWLDKAKAILTKRDAAFEEAIRQTLSHLGFYCLGSQKVANNSSCWASRLRSEETWLRFVRESMPLLQDDGWRITMAPSFTHRIIEPQSDLILSVEQDEDNAGWWFSLSLGIDIDGKRVSLLPIIIDALRAASPAPSIVDIDKLNIQGKFYAPLPDGQQIALPFERVRKILSCLVEVLDAGALSPGGRLSVSIPHLLSLSENIPAGGLDWGNLPSRSSLIEQMLGFDMTQPGKEPEGFLAVLRPTRGKDCAGSSLSRRSNSAVSLPTIWDSVRQCKLSRTY